MGWSTKGVVQCNFLGQGPSFAVALSVPGNRAAGQRAAHVRAATGAPAWNREAAQARPASWPVLPDRVGHAFRVPPAVELESSDGGQALPQAVQQKMESLFDTDFSSVRIHIDSKPETIGAVAFTRGSQIHFAPGHYRPHSPHGQRLLGHELTHVVQQRSGRVGNPFPGAIAVIQDPGLEAEAERMGLRAVQGTARSIGVEPRIAGGRGAGSAILQPMLKTVKKVVDMAKKFDVGSGLLKTSFRFEGLPPGERGSYDVVKNQIVVNKSLKVMYLPTIEHESAHQQHFMTGMMGGDDESEEAESLFLTELTAKRRQMLRIHDGLKEDGWKPSNREEEDLVQEYQLCKDNYQLWLKRLLKTYAQAYQKRFFGVSLTKLGDQVFNSCKNQILDWNASRTGWFG